MLTRGLCWQPTGRVFRSSYSFSGAERTGLRTSIIPGAKDEAAVHASEPERVLEADTNRRPPSLVRDAIDVAVRISVPLIDRWWRDPITHREQQRHRLQSRTRGHA